ncbi:hypothetical protein H2O64_08275 [Kordia sp. YSTF-M3]|uniref:Uncharacterized protein n=1 Tax=Kordia aestuariivivens TaxID=2759037 RepID=A0ABR7Q7Z2_9FLAO|nr:hypothetical protein [Kordia aestuariivivens]MBC8754668.1 hypothetical protein [Kordia aestuariivivens]
MEQLKYSEEKVLKLGKTLILELELDYTGNTLARWMAHYIAELIQKVETSESEEEKEQLKKECCELILELWNKRERVPIKKPTERLKPIISVLELLKENEHPFIPFILPSNSKNIKSKTWSEFLKVVKESSERIFNKSLLSLIDDKILEKDNQWVEKHGEFLSNEEIVIIKYLNDINEVEIQFVDAADDKIEKKDSEKLDELFNQLENFIDEQKNALLSLKAEFKKDK